MILCRKNHRMTPSLSASHVDEDFAIKTVAGNAVADLRARAEYKADSAGAKMRDEQKSKNPDDKNGEEIGWTKRARADSLWRLGAGGAMF